MNHNELSRIVTLYIIQMSTNKPNTTDKILMTESYEVLGLPVKESVRNRAFHLTQQGLQLLHCVFHLPSP